MQSFFKKLKLLVAFAVFLTAYSQAQEKQPDTVSFTLQQAIDYAFQNQASVLNSAIDNEIAQKKINELIGIGLPQINGTASAQRFLRIPTQVIPAAALGGPEGVAVPAQFSLEYQASAGLEATQLIFDGSYMVGIQATKTYAELSRKNYQQSKIETAAAVSKAYYGVLVNTERFDLLNTNIERVRKLKDDTRALLDNGFVEKIDYDRVEVTYNNILAEKTKTEKLLELGKALLKFQMGMDADATLILSDNLKNIAFDEALPAESKADPAQRIEYSILQTTHRLQELDLKKNRFQYFPNLSLFGGLSTYAYRFEFDFLESSEKWYPTAVIGATLSVPIFDGMQKRARIQQSKLNLKKIENNFRSLEQGILFETQTAKAKLENAIVSLEIQRKNRELAGNVARVTKIKYEQGVGLNTEVVDAETALKEAETNYYSALFDALVAKTDYAKATGTLLKN